MPCIWTPSSTTDKLPDQFSIAVSSQVKGSAYYALNPDGTPKLNATPTLDHGLKPLEAPSKTTGTNNTSGPPNFSEWSVSGTQYFPRTPGSGTPGAGGKLTWILPVAVNAKLTGSGQGSVVVQLSASAVFSPLAVTISSDIETSYRKVTSSAELPLKYRPDGTSDGTIDQTKLAPSTPLSYNQGNGPWGVECPRNSDGSMSVESALYWDGARGIWRGPILVTANSQGYTTPVYKWSFSGGLPSGGTPSPYPAPSWNLRGDIDSIWFDSALGQKTTNFNLNVSDKFIPSIGPLNNFYSIDWHLPIENSKEYGFPVKSHTEKPAAIVNYEKTSTHIIDDNIRVVIDPQPLKCTLLLSNGEQVVVGVCFYIGSAITGAWIGEVFGAAALTYEKLALGGVMTGITITKGASTAKALNFDCKNTIGLFQDAIDSTLDFNRGQEGADQRIFPSALASQPDLVTSQSLFEMTPWIKIETTTHFKKGDEYTSKVYTGIAYEKIDTPDAIKVVGHFSLIGQFPQ